MGEFMHKKIHLRKKIKLKVNYFQHRFISFIIIFIISLFIEEFMSFKVVKYAFVGINAGVAFLILKTGIGMFKKIEKKPLPIAVFICVFSLLITFELLSIKFSSVIYIVVGGLIGIIYYAITSQVKEEVK